MENNEVEIVENVQTSAHLVEDYKEACDFNSIRNQIDNCINSIKDNFLKLGYLFNEIVKNKYYLQLDYQTFEDFIKGEYDFGLRTANNFIAIYRKFAEPSENMYCIELKEEYKDYNCSQLVELISVPEDKINEFKPSMNVRELRENKAYLKAKMQLDNELDTSSPRSALSKLINDICNSKSYKYPGHIEEVNLKLSNVKKIDNSYCYMELKFLLVKDMLKINVSADVSKEGTISFSSPFYMTIGLSDYIDGLKPQIKKQLTQKINEEIKYKIDLIEEDNKKAFEREEAIRMKNEFLSKVYDYNSLDILESVYKDVFKDTCYYCINVVKFLYAPIKDKCKFKCTQDEILFKDFPGIELKTINFDNEKIDGVSYEVKFDFEFKYWRRMIKCYLFNSKGDEISSYEFEYWKVCELYFKYCNRLGLLHKTLGIYVLLQTPSDKLDEKHREYLEEAQMYENND